MSEINPYQSPAFSQPLPTYGTTPDPTIVTIAASTLQVMLGQWATFLAVLILICLPWEVLIAYLEYFVATAEDQTVPTMLMLVSPLTAILLAESIVIAATRSHLHGLPGGVPAAFARGITSFPRLFLWMIASSVVIGLGTVICVFPGIYLNIRWMFVSAAAVFDDPPRRSPLDVSWNLTRRHLGFSAIVFLGLCIPMLLAAFGGAILIELIPELQHWLIAVILALFVDLVVIAVTCAFACAYHQLQQCEAAADPAPAEPSSKITD